MQRLVPRRATKPAALAAAPLVALALVLTTLTAAAGRAESPPRGQLIWTQLDGTNFSVHTTLYGPDGKALDPNKLPVKPPGAVINVNDRTLMFSPTGDQLLETATLDPSKPASVVHFLHPAFDFTGRRVLWAGGTTFGPKELPPVTKPDGNVSTLSTVEGGTTLFYGEKGRTVTELSLQQGEAMDAFPTSDPQARWIYFARFFYGPGKVDVPGWYLMRKSREQVAEGTDKSAELVKDGQGRPIYGTQPFVSEAGEYLLYVKTDPENPGSDLWYIRMPPEENEQTKLWEGEGEREFAPPADPEQWDKDQWTKYQERLGRARISNPVLTSDSKLVIFACDRSADTWSAGAGSDMSWDLYALDVTREGDGTLTPGTERAIPQASDPEVDEMWPTVSGDGFWVAFMAKPRTGGPTKLQMLQIRSETDTSGQLSVQGNTKEVDGASDGAMWPRWDQDEDPPTVLVKLNVSDGSPPVTLLIKDQDPDSSAQTDAVTLGIQFRNYNERVPEMPRPSPGDLPLLEMRGEEKSLQLTYQTQGDVGNSFYLLVAGDRDLGLWKGFKTRNPEPVNAGKVDQAQLQVLKGPEFKGLFLGENVRVSVEVLARDNRWKRVPPDDRTESLYSKDPLVEVTQIRETDYRSEAEPDGKRQEPYLDLITKQDNMENKLPGITWWMEEAPQGTTDPGAIKDSNQLNENAPYILFRSGNFPPAQGVAADDPRNQDRFLRIVCRDLISNVTDIRIPIYIKASDFAVNTLRTDTQRSTEGP